MKSPPKCGRSSRSATGWSSLVRRRKSAPSIAPRNGKKKNTSYAWIVKSTALVNNYYFYCVDENFGPFFLKFCSYFPYPAKLCINGHEYLKRQLAKWGVTFEALDNGIKSCADPLLMQRLADGLSAEKIDRLLRKVAAAPAASISSPRPRRRLSLPTLDPAGRVLAHPGVGSAGNGSRFLRGSDPREPRYRASHPGEPGVRPQAEPPHAGQIPHPRYHRRRRAVVAHRRQEDPHQAISQRGRSASNRNHHQ